MNRKFQRFLFASFFCSLMSGPAWGQADSVTWSEIMFKPALSGDSSEFVEIVNFGNTPVDVAGWRIRDNLGLDTIKDAGFGTVLQPGQFAVIFTKNYDIVSGLYMSLVPPSALILKVHDNQIGNTLGNTLDSLRLINAGGDTVSRFSYSVSSSHTAGYSLEKKILNPINTNNWSAGTTLHGTPGDVNSVTPEAYDLSVSGSGIVFSPAMPFQGQAFSVSATVRNDGTAQAGGYQIKFCRVTGTDTVAYHTESGSQINAGDTLVVNATDTVYSQDQWSLVRIIWPSDQDLSNNEASKRVTLAGEPFRIVINEILYAPGTGFSEWVEIVNRSHNPINLKNWKFADASKFSAPVTITAADHVLRPGDFFMLAQDTLKMITQYGALPARMIQVTGWPALNNDLDMVVIFDSVNSIVDSLFYSASWGGSTGGKSLERKNADSSSNASANWGTSIALAGATPGMVNSLTATSYDIGIASIGFVPSFPEKSQEYSVAVKIKNYGTLPADTFQIRVIRRTGSDSLILLQAEYYNLADSLMLSVPDTALTSGQILFAELFYTKDQKSFNNTASRTLVFGAPGNSLVINEIMYSPATGHSEWIELVNRSPDTLDLRKWQIADEAAFTSNSFKTITSSSYLVFPGEYVILYEDSNEFRAQYPDANIQRFRPGSWVSLNESDMLVLADSLGKIVDSLFYENSWGGSSDRSLERKDAEASSVSSSNWGTSIALAGATPGMVNSLTPFDLDLSVSSGNISCTPVYPQAGDTIEILAVIRNSGLLKVRNPFSLILYNDENLDGTGTATEKLDSAGYDSLAQGDSVIYSHKWLFPAEQLIKKVSMKYFASLDSIRLIVKISFPGDERQDNNQAYKTIRIGIKPQSVVINEALYYPDTNQVEFIELFNRSEDTLNLRNWGIHDASVTSKKYISSEDLYFLPGSYFVLTSDTGVYRKYPDLSPASVIIVRSLAAFNNDKDAVVIKDAIGAVVDSVYYYNTWGGKKGISLERIDVNRYTNDPGNWGSSIAVGGASPGNVNGILSARPAFRNALVINEIMFGPFTGEPEYVEFYNPSDSSVNIANWSFQVNETKVILTTSSFEVPAGEYAVISEDRAFPARYKTIPRLLKQSNMPNLSNTGATLMIRDLVGTVIDSVAYDPDWGGSNGLSIERIRPAVNANVRTNWGSCVFAEGGTPGYLNSIFTDEDQPDKIRLTADPNPFFADQDQQTKITIELPVLQARLTLKIFDNQGRHIRTLLNNSHSGGYREVFWDGKDQKGHIARMGIYVMLLEAINENPRFSKSVKKTVVLGRKL